MTRTVPGQEGGIGGQIERQAQGKVGARSGQGVGMAVSKKVMVQTGAQITVQSGAQTGAQSGAQITVQTTAPLTLQRLILPDPAICTETDLYATLNDLAFLRLTQAEIVFLPGGQASFDTYMNLFNLGVWARAASLPGLTLRLRGEGRCHLRLWRQTRPQDAGQALIEDIITLSPGGVTFDIATLMDLTTRPEGLLCLRLTALSNATLTGGAWETAQPTSLKPHRLAISITTFRREAAVALTAARVTAFLDGEGGHLLAAAGTSAHLFMVDNGQSASPAPHPALSVIPNANLGGAGGFARGLAAAQDGGFSHCLFMDDDASFQMEALLRTAAFLQLADSPRAAVSGAMISAVRPDRMWENGAVFDRLCRPQHVGTDLRDPRAVAGMELSAARAKPPGFYAGWWYFAFPLAHVRHYPFPFFVRGDDISFSLVHRFDSVTLNGVVSFQEDFSAKESPLTLYLDLRNHLHHHLVQDGMEIGANGTAKIVARFLLRSIVRMHYDSAEAQLLAWDDVMAGPAFFADNADMTAKRPQVLALARTEAWRAVEPGDLALPELSDTPPGPGFSRFMKYTLNGHLLPFWRRFGRQVRIPVSHRGLIWALWGLKGAVFVNADETRAYRVSHSKPRAFGLIWRALRTYLRWRAAYPGLQSAHRAAYAEMTARRFWEARFLPAPAVIPGPTSPALTSSTITPPAITRPDNGPA